MALVRELRWTGTRNLWYDAVKDRLVPHMDDQESLPAVTEAGE
jgi:hypothetical protein